MQRKQQGEVNQSGGDAFGDELLRPIERSIAYARSEALRYRAAQDPDVVEFRHWLHPVGLLSQEGAQWIVDSPVLAYVSRADIDAMGISPLSHQPELVQSPVPLPESQMLIRVHPTGHEITLDLTDSERETLRFDSLDRREIVVRTIRRGSVLDDLRRIADKLERQYFWTEGQATNFVLTGVAPSANAVVGVVTREQSEEFSNATINLHIDPSVSAETVLAVYRRLLDTLGLSGYQLESKSVALFHFVERRRGTSPGPVSFRQLTEEWNDAMTSRDRPDWTYSHPAALQRSYYNARDRILSPQYRLPNDPDEPVAVLPRKSRWTVTLPADNQYDARDGDHTDERVDPGIE